VWSMGTRKGFCSLVSRRDKFGKKFNIKMLN